MSEQKGIAGMTADEAMGYIKNRKHTVTRQDLQAFYDASLQLLAKFKSTGQVAAAKKCVFHIDCAEKEMQLVEMGIDTFIYDDDIQTYIREVSTDDVRLCELQFYEREIPDEIVDIINKTKGLFTSYWVLYTDYTDSAKAARAKRAAIDQARMSRDPILFGVQLDEAVRTMNERYYFLGDWVDEYCDLTLEKFLDGMKAAGKTNVEHKIRTPLSLAEMREDLDKLQLVHGSYRVVEDSVPTKLPWYRQLLNRWRAQK